MINILLYFLIFIVLILIIYSLIYIFTECNKKKTFLAYILNLNPFEVCDQPGEADYIEREILDDKEVFLIGNQDYNYQQAQKKCQAYGAELATKNQIINAYNKGADYCLYGWAKGQQAFYPTQLKTFEKMYNTKQRYACGLPGVNGGYFENPNLKFGATCYGVKPAGAVIKPKSLLCKKKTFCEKKYNISSCMKTDNDEVIPFNKNEWSMYN